jgi:hypothetical protein
LQSTINASTLSIINKRGLIFIAIYIIGANIGNINLRLAHFQKSKEKVGRERTRKGRFFKK